MNGVRHEGPLKEGEIYQCSQCGGLVKSFALIDIDGKEYRPEMIRHIGWKWPLCPDAYVERLWP